jgi:hypothetical protein
MTTPQPLDCRLILLHARKSCQTESPNQRGAQADIPICRFVSARRGPDCARGCWQAPIFRTTTIKTTNIGIGTTKTRDGTTTRITRIATTGMTEKRVLTSDGRPKITATTVTSLISNARSSRNTGIGATGRGPRRIPSKRRSPRLASAPKSQPSFQTAIMQLTPTVEAIHRGAAPA